AATRPAPPKVKLADQEDAALRVVYVCDATGSMMKVFPLLQDVVTKSIEGLQPPQSFTIVMFMEAPPPPLSKTLLPATPANKRKGVDFITAVLARGPTEP